MQDLIRLVSKAMTTSLSETESEDMYANVQRAPQRIHNMDNVIKQEKEDKESKITRDKKARTDEKTGVRVPQFSEVFEMFNYMAKPNVQTNIDNWE